MIRLDSIRKPLSNRIVAWGRHSCLPRTSWPKAGKNACPTRFSDTVLVALIAAICLASQPASAKDRYLLIWRDGSPSSIDELPAWDAAGSNQAIGDRPLFDDERGIRAIVATTPAPAQQPAEFVEFFGGDRLPGRAIGVRHDADSPSETSDLLIEPAAALMPNADSAAPLRVRTASIRRIVWQRRGSDRYVPATLWQRDGRQITFRSLRWTSEGVRLLLEAETALVPLEQIAELHMPRQPAWEVWLDALARLGGEKLSRIVQLETTTGLSITSSNERITPVAGAAAPKRVMLRSQPAWSPEGVMIAVDDTVSQWYFAPYEVPLSSIEPIASNSRHALGGAWGEAQRNRNVEGGRLASGGREFAWGYGVHAEHELAFELHPLAIEFRTQMGLDALAGSGGCARGVVSLTGAGDTNATELFRSPLVVGSASPVDTGWLKLPAARSADARLLLVADSAGDETPAGADPLDIRDIWDWLEPIVRLDREALRAELARRSGPKN
ncbi:MAG TPA: NPCBM/NEW2 domain-containing protein [Pirellulales bacterium]|jgi:hypothetical protein|nr:NPCBM/NEW2 domain-containing protein [Pirellulales bacterium]